MTEASAFLSGGKMVETTAADADPVRLKTGLHFVESNWKDRVMVSIAPVVTLNAELPEHPPP